MFAVIDIEESLKLIKLILFQLAVVGFPTRKLLTTLITTIKMMKNREITYYSKKGETYYIFIIILIYIDIKS